MNGRGIAGLALVAVWLLLGPVAMAFDGCVGCDLPCAQMSCTVTTQALAMAPEAVALAGPVPESHLVTATPPTFELPPKSLLSAA